MRLRTLAACVAIAGTVSGAAIAISDLLSKEPVPPELASAGNWTPQRPEAPLNVDIPMTLPAAAWADDAPDLSPLPLAHMLLVTGVGNGRQQTKDGDHHHQLQQGKAARAFHRNCRQ